MSPQEKAIQCSFSNEPRMTRPAKCGGRVANAVCATVGKKTSAPSQIAKESNIRKRKGVIQEY